jgi:hypothetical protein
MAIDLYTKLMLTLIAGCLLAIAVRRGPSVESAVAQAAITCQGQLKANAHGGNAPNVGGYQLQVSCH